MNGKPLVIDGKFVGVMCGNFPKPKACIYCGKESTKLCDFPVGRTKAGKKKTCDLPLCDTCALKGVSADVDFCKPHYPLAKAAYERRMEKLKCVQKSE